MIPVYNINPQSLSFNLPLACCKLKHLFKLTHVMSDTQIMHTSDFNCGSGKRKIIKTVFFFPINVKIVDVVGKGFFFDYDVFKLCSRICKVLHALPLAVW